MSRRVERPRRSAKRTVTEFAEELLKRPRCEDTQAKLLALQTIALRMSWTDLYNSLRFRTQPALANFEDKPEPKEPWWNK